MDYAQFRAEYDPVFDVLGGKTLPDWLPVAVARLKQMAAAIEDASDRRTAENRIAAMESIIEEDLDGQPISPAMMEAIRVYSEAGASHGTPAERIARAETGMAAIGRIAEKNPSEEASIMELNSSLYTLMLALRS
jgi:hypothetical protein